MSTNVNTNTTQQPKTLEEKLFMSRDEIKAELIAKETTWYNKAVAWIKISVGYTKIDSLGEKLEAAMRAAFKMSDVHTSGDEALRTTGDQILMTSQEYSDKVKPAKIKADRALKEFYEVFKKRCSNIEKADMAECIEIVAKRVLCQKDSNSVNSFDQTALKNMLSSFNEMNYNGMIFDFANTDSKNLTKEAYDALVRTLGSISGLNTKKIKESLNSAILLSNKGHIENLEKLATTYKTDSWDKASKEVQTFLTNSKKELEEKKLKDAQKINELRGVDEKSEANKTTGLKKTTNLGTIHKAYEAQQEAQNKFDAAWGNFLKAYKEAQGNGDETDPAKLLNFIVNKEVTDPKWIEAKKLGGVALEAYNVLEKAKKNLADLKKELEDLIPSNGWNGEEPSSGPFMDLIKSLEEGELQKAAMDKANALSKSYSEVKSMIELHKNGRALNEHQSRRTSRSTDGVNFTKFAL